MNRNNQIKINLSKKKKEEIEVLFNEYEDLANISSYGNKSDIYADAIINHLNNLLASHIPHTQTNSHSLTKQRKDAIYSMIEKIKEKGYMFFMQIYSNLILSNDCYSEVKMRSRSSYFQSLLQSEDLYFLNVSYYFDTKQKAPIVAIHRQSKYFPQLKDLCFSIRQPVFKLTHDNMIDAKLRDQVFVRLKNKSNYKSNLDRAERTMLNAFLYEIGIIEENPIYDNSDFIMQDVIQLRSEHRFSEAAEVFENEKKQKQSVKISNDEGLTFLEGISK